MIGYGQIMASSDKRTINGATDRPTALHGRATLVEALGHCAAPRRRANNNHPCAIAQPPQLTTLNLHCRTPAGSRVVHTPKHRWKRFVFLIFYSASDRGAEYCDARVCLFVCMYVRLSAK